MEGSILQRSLADLSAGTWVVGVSGGADSVALLVALRRLRPDIRPTVAHLDHEFRGNDSREDAEFVSRLCQSFDIPCVIRRLGELSPTSPNNLEASFRAARHALFEDVVQQAGGQGVLLAHHAGDRAETVLMRLLRGSDAVALDGLRADTVINGLRIVRPFLSLKRMQLEAYLLEQGQPWREDASNESDAFARNRTRKWLADHPNFATRLLHLADAAAQWRKWVHSHAPAWGDAIAAAQLADLPDPVARHAIRAWLLDRDVPADEVPPSQIDAILAMARDRAAPGSVNLPQGRTVRRHRAEIVLN